MLLSYYTAVSTVPYVGQDTALLLKSLVAHKALNLKDVHFVGHSLGAHASGLASKPFKGKIGRITGLDPAGLTFHQVPPQERIDSSDAGYVDIMHANSCYNKWNPWGNERHILFEDKYYFALCLGRCSVLSWQCLICGDSKNSCDSWCSLLCFSSIGKHCCCRDHQRKKTAASEEQLAYK
ncbi:hypothetical protein OTU49_009280 [Cherax quadricarinatus]|uniref:Lipase domain-containing protein n=1 Tax=Cherax quadricarinatus TaxID=27406 RepID=A0AAW0WMD3_CHEQU